MQGGYQPHSQLTISRRRNLQSADAETFNQPTVNLPAADLAAPLAAVPNAGAGLSGETWRLAHAGYHRRAREIASCPKGRLRAPATKRIGASQ